MSFENYVNPLFETEVSEAYEALARHNVALLKGVGLDHQRLLPEDDALAHALDEGRGATVDEVENATNELVRKAEIEVILGDHGAAFGKVGMRAVRSTEVVTDYADVLYPIKLELVNPTKFSQYMLYGEPSNVHSRHAREAIVQDVLQTLQERRAVCGDLVELVQGNYEAYETLRKFCDDYEVLFECVERWLVGEGFGALPVFRELRQSIDNPQIL